MVVTCFKMVKLKLGANACRHVSNVSPSVSLGLAFVLDNVPAFYFYNMGSLSAFLFAECEKLY